MSASSLPSTALILADPWVDLMGAAHLYLLLAGLLTLLVQIVRRGRPFPPAVDFIARTGICFYAACIILGTLLIGTAWFESVGRWEVPFTNGPVFEVEELQAVTVLFSVLLICPGLLGLVLWWSIRGASASTILPLRLRAAGFAGGLITLAAVVSGRLFWLAVGDQLVLRWGVLGPVWKCTVIVLAICLIPMLAAAVRLVDVAIRPTTTYQQRPEPLGQPIRIAVALAAVFVAAALLFHLAALTSLNLARLPGNISSVLWRMRGEETLAAITTFGPLLLNPLLGSLAWFDLSGPGYRGAV